MKASSSVNQAGSVKKIIAVIFVLNLTMMFIFLKGITHNESTLLQKEHSQDSVYEVQEEQPQDNVHEVQDGEFNGFPVYYRSMNKQPSFHSTVQCTGDNFTPESWKYKSCHFRNLCFDTSSYEFVIFPSEEQLNLEKILSNENLTFFSASSSTNQEVSLGALNAIWTTKDKTRLRWFPTVRGMEELKNGFYELPSDSVMATYHSFAGGNPGHLLWDDFLPLYTILTMFDILDKQKVLLRYVLNETLWASCDFKGKQRENNCEKVTNKFLPLLGVNPKQFSSIHNFNFSASHEDGIAKSKYVCAPAGVGGIGMLSDHGERKHGWNPSDYVNYNQNRGKSFYEYRNFLLNNIHVSTAPLSVIKKKFRILFSIHSSITGNRDTDFSTHIELVKRKLGEKYDLEILSVELSKYSVKEQVEMIAETSIYITICGGGAFSALFLPKGASLIVYFNEKDGVMNTPARLDWDYFNHMGYVRTHWLPRPKFGMEIDLEAFTSLVDHELDTISQL